MKMPNAQRVGGGRSLHWERGLKLLLQRVPLLVVVSLPSLGAWIETPEKSKVTELPQTSLPSLGAWIETNHSFLTLLKPGVAPFIGSVD